MKKFDKQDAKIIFESLFLISFLAVIYLLFILAASI